MEIEDHVEKGCVIFQLLKGFGPYFNNYILETTEV